MKDNVEEHNKSVTRSWKHKKVKGLCHGHGTCHLNIYKKNSLRVLLSKRERFCPGSRSLTFVSKIREDISIIIKVTSNYQEENLY